MLVRVSFVPCGVVEWSETLLVQVVDPHGELGLQLVGQLGEEGDFAFTSDLNETL